MTSPRQWIAGARPKTLPAAIAPVLVGTALAGANWMPGRALLALVVALALQVGVNYANDYSDGIRGTDNARVGPVRLVGQGLAPAHRVRTAAFLSFGAAAVAGLVLVALSGHWWLLLVGAASIAAAWLYTGGPRPYGYSGFGEVFVFVFFGLVPVLGTLYVQTGVVDANAVLASIGVGSLACAILVTNNLRDIPSDSQAGKLTLAVRLGDRRTRRLYVLLVMAAFAMVALIAITNPWTLIGLLAAPWAIRPLRVVMKGAVGPGLIPALVSTGRLVIAYAVALSLGLLAPLILGL
jgi:1,4-dihydroxy-2-naphthoate polyprenyltransferase